MSEWVDALSAGSLVAEAAERFRGAGVPSPENDARLLLAHVLKTRPGTWWSGSEVSPADAESFRELVAGRAERIPLQHLTGKAYFGHVELEVGPGVFIPRPETEMMMSWAADQLMARTAQLGRRQVAVDLCTGSGAIAKSLALAAPTAEIHAVELSGDAVSWAERNLAGTGVRLVQADMADALPELDGDVDLVVANPPYVPLEAYDSVAVEARDHDPGLALFSGLDGLDAIRVLTAVAGRLLRDGGLLTFEHAEVQAESAPQVVVESHLFSQVRDNQDLTGRQRFVTAVRNARALAGWDE
ncbi:MAG TPA: peptide chain release factor N(5)-glutamine methyltransferase [Microlunatus sp.]|nr:peptide chain release factor N(5)-glutamine methyltransferase [Microlunatus sp.]